MNYVVCHPITNLSDAGRPWSRGDIVTDLQLFPGSGFAEDREEHLDRLLALQAITTGTVLLADGTLVDPNP